jgi:Na+-driven multidrug efflux pump
VALKKKKMAITDEELGTTDIKKLLIKQAAPASIGILFMSLNILIDTILGQWIGPLAIAVVTVVFPITFLISSLGMAIGVGGVFCSFASFRCKKNRKKAKLLLPIKL